MEDTLSALLAVFFSHVEIDSRRVVHDVSIIFSGENEPGAAHVRGQLVNFGQSLIDDVGDEARIAQVPDREVIGRGYGVLVFLQVDTAHPVTLVLQSLHQVPTDESACTTDQRAFLICHTPSPFFH